MDDRKNRRRKTYVMAIRVGTTLGLLLFTAYLTVRILKVGIEVAEVRAGAMGGEICIIPLIALLFWAGWTFRKEYESMKEGEKEDVRTQYRIYPRSEK